MNSAPENPEPIAAAEIPRYSIPAAAQYLRISPSTLGGWIRDRSNATASGSARWNCLIDRPQPHDSRLSFFNLVEGYVLNALRKQYQVPFSAIRTALVHAEKHYGIHHLLHGDQLRVKKGSLFLKHLGQLIDGGRGRQEERILEAYLERIEWSLAGFVAKLSPVTRDEPRRSPRLILIDPEVGFGKPIVRSKGIKTSMISERFQLGESIGYLAEDYGLEIDEIEEAIRCERPGHRAA